MHVLLAGEPLAGGPVPGGPVPAEPAMDAWLPGDGADASRAGALQPDALQPGAPSARRVRWAPDRRAVAMVAIAVLVAAVATIWWVLSSRPRQIAVQSAGPGGDTATVAVGSASPLVGAAGSPTRSATHASAAPVVVDVAGKVRRPGVYELAAGSRVIDALRAAGGVRHGVSTTTLNLAARVSDGEQVVVGAAGAGLPGPAGSGSPATATVPLNTATLQQLETLPGVGPVLAQRILDWRTQHGQFNSVSQLDEVSGIGPATFADLRGRVTL